MISMVPGAGSEHIARYVKIGCNHSTLAPTHVVLCSDSGAGSGA